MKNEGERAKVKLTDVPFQQLFVDRDYRLHTIYVFAIQSHDLGFAIVWRCDVNLILAPLQKEDQIQSS